MDCVVLDVIYIGPRHPEKVITNWLSTKFRAPRWLVRGRPKLRERCWEKVVVETEVSKNLLYLPSCLFRSWSPLLGYLLQYQETLGRVKLFHDLLHIRMGFDGQCVAIYIRNMEPPWIQVRLVYTYHADMESFYHSWAHMAVNSVCQAFTLRYRTPPLACSSDESCLWLLQHHQWLWG